MNLIEIGKKIHAQRQGILSQKQLAKLTGLSRVTINQLENGTLTEIGFSKLITVLSIVGMDLQINPTTGLHHALATAAKTISTSFRDPISPSELARILRTGEAPEKYHPHLMVLLDETPLPLVIKAIQEAAGKTSIKKILQYLAKWATEWKLHRVVWS